MQAPNPTTKTRWILCIVFLATTLLIAQYFRHQSSNTLNVTPDAREAIEKAKRR